MRDPKRIRPTAGRLVAESQKTGRNIYDIVFDGPMSYYKEDATLVAKYPEPVDNELTDRIVKVWEKMPDMRLAQLLTNMGLEGYDKYKELTNEVIVKALEDYYGG